MRCKENTNLLHLKKCVVKFRSLKVNKNIFMLCQILQKSKIRCIYRNAVHSKIKRQLASGVCIFGKVKFINFTAKLSVNSKTYQLGDVSRPWLMIILGESSPDLFSRGDFHRWCSINALVESIFPKYIFLPI